MEISGRTALIGLIGWPVEHSYSPAMHNAAAQALGLDLVYVPLPVRPDALEAAVRGLVALGYLGANVTIPHKQKVIGFLDEVTPAARAIGAVNTIRVMGRALTSGDRVPETIADTHKRAREDEQAETAAPPSPHTGSVSLQGANTDWQGFLTDLADKGVTVRGRVCLILGAGGSARAVAYGLARAGGVVQVCARRPAQAQALVTSLVPHLPREALSTRPWESRAEAGPKTLIVNTTPVGMHPHEGKSPWPEAAALPEDGFVYDLVYNPARTRLIAQAEAADCRVANGLGMLLHQGALAFQMWTGIRPEIEMMKAPLRGLEQ